MNIEISGGLIYEIINADPDWVQGEGGHFLSGTKVILPVGTEIIAPIAKIDFKGGKPRVWVDESEGQNKRHCPARPRKILITGSSGYVGQHLLSSLSLQGIISSTNSSNEGRGDAYELFLAYNDLSTFEDDVKLLFDNTNTHSSIVKIQPIPNVDFSKSDYIHTIQQTVGSTTLDAIIHLAALSSPAFCENHVADAWRINCPTDLLSFHAPIIYLSTDQVYEGTKSYYQEDTDETLPANVYGRTKLAFERVLLGNSDKLLSEIELGSHAAIDGQYISDIKSVPPPNNKSIILRCSLILGGPTPLKRGCRKGAFPSFLQFIESRLQSSTDTEYFVNEYRSVVSVEDVLRAIRHFLIKVLDGDDSSLGKTGLYNLGGSARVSRYDIALQLAKHLKLDESTAHGVERPTSAVGVPSPPDISMNVTKIEKEMGGAKMDGLREIIQKTFRL